MNNTETYETTLLSEKEELENQLNALGTKVGENNWDVTAKDPDQTEEDETVQADQTEEIEVNAATLAVIEARHNDVIDALGKIENGTFGVCEICGSEIEDDRLGANAAARTCKAHME